MIHCFVSLSVHYSLIHWLIDSPIHWFIDLFAQSCMDSVMSFHWHIYSMCSFVGTHHNFNTLSLSHLWIQIVVYVFQNFWLGPGTTDNLDMVQTCSNCPGGKFVPRMWKTNPDATIEDLDGKSGPGATNLSDATRLTHLTRQTLGDVLEPDM